MGKEELTWWKEGGGAQSTLIFFPHSKASAVSESRHLLAIAANRWVSYSAIAHCTLEFNELRLVEDPLFLGNHTPVTPSVTLPSSCT